MRKRQDPFRVSAEHSQAALDAIAAIWQTADGPPTPHFEYREAGGQTERATYVSWDADGPWSEQRRGPGYTQPTAADAGELVKWLPGALSADCQQYAISPQTHRLIWRARPEIAALRGRWMLYMRLAFVPLDAQIVDEMEGEQGVQDRILTTQFGQYAIAAWDGVNRSGMKALCDKVIVLCDDAVDVTRGGVIIAEVSHEQQKLAATSGVLVSVGPQAFAYDSNRLVHWEGERPKAGDRVFFTKYAGLEQMGQDGRLYRLMDDRSIGAVEDVQMPVLVSERETADTA